MKPVRPVRIMQVIARMNTGGPAVIVTELMSGLDKHRFEQILITGYCEDDESDYLDQFSIDIPVTRIKNLGKSVSVLEDIKSFYALVRIMRQFKPNIIHTHTAKAGVIGRLAGLFARPSAKRIHTFHGHLLLGYFGPLTTRIVVLIEKALAKITFSLIAIGNKVKLDLLEHKIGNESKFSVIFPGLRDIELQSKTSAREELGLTQDRTYIVFVGRLTQIKRPDRLIDLARYLLQMHPKVEIIIAGAGEKFEEIQHIVKIENLPIILLGWRNDVGRILSASDIAVLCSDNEGIPLTLIQASQAGLPIVSTNVGSVNDIVINGQTGVLTDIDSESIIQSIHNLLGDTSRIKRFGEAGKLRAQSQFSLEGMLKAHEHLYLYIAG